MRIVFISFRSIPSFPTLWVKLNPDTHGGGGRKKERGPGQLFHVSGTQLDIVPKLTPCVSLKFIKGSKKGIFGEKRS